MAFVSTLTPLWRSSITLGFQLKVSNRLCLANAKQFCRILARKKTSYILSQNFFVSQIPEVLKKCSFCKHQTQSICLLKQPLKSSMAASEFLLRMKESVCTKNIGQVRGITGEAKNKASYRKKTSLIYICAAGIFMLGMSYAGVPLYRMFCQATGLGGTVSRGHDTSKVESMQAVPNRVIRVRFNADVASSMQWNFKPQQTEVKVIPGETALAFYTAKNPTDKPIIGISTYNVVPFEAGQYFNKIQCFCFEEQRLNPHEQITILGFGADIPIAKEHREPV